MRILTVLAMLLTLFACGGSTGSETVPTNITPIQAIYLSDRIVSGDEVTSMLSAWINQRNDEAKALYGVTSLPDYSLQIIDDFNFPCGTTSYSGYCIGLYVPENYEIYAATYNRIDYDHMPNLVELTGKAVYTLKSSQQLCDLTHISGWCEQPGWWMVGYIPSGQIGLAVLPHEIGHLLNINVD